MYLRRRVFTRVEFRELDAREGLAGEAEGGLPVGSSSDEDVKKESLEEPNSDVPTYWSRGKKVTEGAATSVMDCNKELRVVRR